MAEIFRAPSEIALPKIDFSNYDYAKAVAADKKYIEDLKAHIKSCGYKGKNVGEVLSIPHADGAAQYMVLKMRPLQLVHLELGDAWNAPMADLLTAARVNEMIESKKRMDKLFPSRG